MHDPSFPALERKDETESGSVAGLTKRRIEADRGRVTTDVAGVSG